VIVQHSSGEYVKQVRGKSPCPKIRKTAKKNRMSSMKSGKTKISVPLVTRGEEGRKKKKGKKEKDELTTGQIKLYIFGTEGHQVDFEPAVLSH